MEKQERSVLTFAARNFDTTNRETVEEKIL